MTTSEQTIDVPATPTAAATANNSVTVQLDEPFQRGDTVINRVELRQPKAGELRGVSLLELAHLDVGALQKVLPRITQPLLSIQEVNQLAPADLIALGAEVANFLVKKADRNRSLTV